MGKERLQRKPLTVAYERPMVPWIRVEALKMEKSQHTLQMYFREFANG